MRTLTRCVAARRPQARTLLDIGAGTGLMVSEAQRGLAARRRAQPVVCDTAARVNQVELFCGTVENGAIHWAVTTSSLWWT